MADKKIRFEDGAAYERMMGVWSALAGETFLDWLAPRPGLHWLDVGCGSGAFSALVAKHCAPAAIEGVDPSPAQIAFARARSIAAPAQFREGDAMALPLADDSVDAAVMALVIFFLSDPAKGVAEMARVVRPGGLAAAYAWDMAGGGFPPEPIIVELRAMGHSPMRPPSVDASRIDAMRTLWSGAGLVDIETRQIATQRTFADFEDFWTTTILSSSVKAVLAALPAAEIEVLKSRVRTSLKVETGGKLTCAGRANAIKGRVPQ
jgi:ubiquinone/menaquinone biosynthesis C-methylase UbiE